MSTSNLSNRVTPQYDIRHSVDQCGTQALEERALENMRPFTSGPFPLIAYQLMMFAIWSPQAMLGQCVGWQATPKTRPVSA